MSNSGPDIEAMTAVAYELLDGQDYEGAMASFREIMSADAESPEGLAGIIRCMVGTKDPDGAREIVDQLEDEFREKPSMKAAIDVLIVSEKVAQSAGSVNAAKAAVEADPNDLAARQDLAMALFVGQEEESMDQLLDVGSY